MLFNSVIIPTLFAASTYASCLHGTSHQLRRIKRDGEVAISNFGYTGDKGPFSWAALADANSACSLGKQQSPINIDASIARARVAPQMTIANVEEAEFENLGTTIEVVMEEGELKVQNDTLSLKQFHFHSPSEHRINEEYFPLEMHMVHEATDGSGRIVVMAVLFQLAEDATTTTDLLTGVTKNIAAIAEPGKITQTGPLDFAPLIQHLSTTPLIEYAGSLTTPPCTEGPVFFITEQPMPINVVTFNAMKKVIKFNSRFTQNTLGRENILMTGAAVAQAALDKQNGGAASSEQSISQPSTAAAVVTTSASEAQPTGAEDQFLTITEMAIAGKRVPTSIIAKIAKASPIA